MKRALTLLCFLALPAHADVTYPSGKTVECYCTDTSGSRLELGPPLCLHAAGPTSMAQPPPSPHPLHPPTSERFSSVRHHTGINASNRAASSSHRQLLCNANDALCCAFQVSSLLNNSIAFSTNASSVKATKPVCPGFTRSTTEPKLRTTAGTPEACASPTASQNVPLITPR